MNIILRSISKYHSYGIIISFIIISNSLFTTNLSINLKSEDETDNLTSENVFLTKTSKLSTKENSVEFPSFFSLLPDTFYYIDSLYMDHFGLNNNFDTFTAITTHNNNSASGETIFVLSQDSSEVICFDLNSTIITRWGTFGTGDGEFMLPSDIEVSSLDGKVYVADTLNRRIQVFNSIGYLLNIIDLSPLDVYPRLIAIDSKTSSLYVVGTGVFSSKVLNIDFSGNLNFEFGEIGSGEQQIEQIRGICFDEENKTIYITDIHDRVQVFDENGTWIKGWGEEGILFGMFDGAFDVFFDNKHNYTFVVDTNNGRIQFFSETNYEGSISGIPEAEFLPLENPIRMAYSVNNDLLFVIDNSSCIKVYTSWEDQDGDEIPNGWERYYGFDVSNSADKYLDNDIDLLPNNLEYEYHTNPNNNDTDRDGITDGWEIQNGLNPLLNDSLLDPDNDNLSNFQEYVYNTNPYNNDTDSDGMNDGWEVVYELDPLIWDANSDDDNDGLTNIEEYYLNIHPNNNDTDSDGMVDGWEIQYALNPLIDDSALDLDYDGLSNIQEFQYYTNPRNNDTDSDGMDDGWEIQYALNPLIDDSALDPDNDSLSNVQEFQYYTNPRNNDTDSDAMDDGWEIQYALNPLIDDSNEDSDNDGLLNIEEYELGTNPSNKDTDGDGFSDSWENKWNLSPLNKFESPLTIFFLPALFTLIFLVGLVFLLKKHGSILLWKTSKKYKQKIFSSFFMNFTINKVAKLSDNDFRKQESPKLYVNEYIDNLKKHFEALNPRFNLTKNTLIELITHQKEKTRYLEWKDTSYDEIEFWSINDDLMTAINYESLLLTELKGSSSLTIRDYNLFSVNSKISTKVIAKHLKEMEYQGGWDLVIDKEHDYSAGGASYIFTRYESVPQKGIIEIEKSNTKRRIEELVKKILPSPESLIEVTQYSDHVKIVNIIDEIRQRDNKILEKLDLISYQGDIIIATVIENPMKLFKQIQQTKEKIDDATRVNLLQVITRGLLVKNIVANKNEKLFKALKTIAKIVIKSLGTSFIPIVIPFNEVPFEIAGRLTDWIGRLSD